MMIENPPQHPLFEALTDEQRERLYDACEPRQLEGGENLFRMGEPAERFWQMAQGQVKLYRVSPHGQEKIVELLSPPQTFAEAVMFMEHRRYPVNAEALEPSVVLGYSSRVFLAMLDESPGTSLRMLGNLAMRLRRRLNDIDALSLQNATLRVTNFLLQVRHDAADATIALPFAKKNIAARLSLQPETLSRVFARLKDRGVIAIHGQEVEILDLDALREIAISG